MTLAKKRIKKSHRQKVVLMNFEEYCRNNDFIFKNDLERNHWKNFIETQTEESYLLDTILYAQKWAQFMQYVIENHNTSIFNIASQAACFADPSCSISGFMYIISIHFLSKVWKYGDQLSQWHNSINPKALTY